MAPSRYICAVLVASKVKPAPLMVTVWVPVRLISPLPVKLRLLPDKVSGALMNRVWPLATSMVPLLRVTPAPVSDKS